ncbi:MAG: hypothetical protein GX219_04920 [Tissierellia bacterium]|nr:hypothetical protein [Tissierellia bacterium]
MSYQKRHLSRKFRKALYYIVLMSILAFVAYSVIRIFNDTSPKTAIPERTTFYDQVEARGILILDQDFIDVSDNEDVQVFHKEGERVSVSGKLFQLVRYNEEQLSAISELDKINQALGQGDGLTSVNYFTDVDLVKEALGKGDFIAAKLILDEIKTSNTELQFKNVRKEEVIVLDGDEETLKIRKEELENLLAGSEGELVRSPRSGIVSYLPTRYGKKFDLTNYQDINLEDFDYKTDESQEPAREEIRVIDNFKSVIALEIKDSKDIAKLEERTSLLVGNDKIGEIKARALELKKESDKAILFVEVSDEIHNFYLDELADYKIILNKRGAYTLPVESLIEDERGTGVYIKHKASIVKYRPVELISKKGDYIYVSVGDNNSTIENKTTGKREYTIGIFDEVFIHPEALKEDMVVR